MKVALYARVSTSDQDCAMQLAELRQICQARAWTSTEYIDTGWSGQRSDRPQLMKLMKDAYLYGAVLVWKLDRFGRSVEDLVQNIRRLESAGVRFIAVSQSIDTDRSNPTSRLLLHMLAAIAEFEAEIAKERVKAGLEHAKRVGTRSGKPPGRPRKVFRRDQVLELRASGKSYRDIARALDLSLGLVARTCTKYHMPEAWPGDGSTQLSNSA